MIDPQKELEELRRAQQQDAGTLRELRERAATLNQQINDLTVQMLKREGGIEHVSRLLADKTKD